MIVLDASAAVELVLQTVKAAVLESRLLHDADESRFWHAPHLLDVEVAHVLRRHVSAGFVTPERGREALEDLADLPLVSYPHYTLLRRIWELRHNLSAYDAAYVALAEALDATLLTCDAKIMAAPGHHAQVEVV